MLCSAAASAMRARPCRRGLGRVQRGGQLSDGRERGRLVRQPHQRRRRSPGVSSVRRAKSGSRVLFQLATPPCSRPHMASVPANRWPWRSASPVVIMPPSEVPQAMVRRGCAEPRPEGVQGGQLGRQGPLHHPAGLRIRGADLRVARVEQGRPDRGTGCVLGRVGRPVGHVAVAVEQHGAVPVGRHVHDVGRAVGQHTLHMGWCVVRGAGGAGRADQPHDDADRGQSGQQASAASSRRLLTRRPGRSWPARPPPGPRPP